MSKPRFYAAVSDGFDANGRLVVDAYVLDRVNCCRVITRQSWRPSRADRWISVRQLPKTRAALRRGALYWARTAARARNEALR